MKTTNENQDVTVKLKHAFARKRVPSMLDPFTEQLLQMDTEKKTLNEMMAWLKTQDVETVASNLSDFLASRRQRRQAKRQLDGEKNLIEVLQEWMAENPNATLEAVMERFRMLALSLSMKQEAAPEVLKLADRLAWTASRVANDQSRAEYRTQKLSREQETHRECIKSEQTRALPLCLAEAKKNNEVATLFRQAFAALKATQPKTLRKEDATTRVPPRASQGN